MALLLCLCTASAYSAPKNLLVLGDSLSAEYGLARGSGWVALLEKKLQAQKVDIQIINASVSGETTVGGRTRLPALLKAQQPAIVIIELGGNDGLRGLQQSATEDNLRAMIRMSKEAKAKVLLVGMRLPPNYGKDYTERFYQAYAKIAAAEQVALVPFLLEGVAEHDNLFQPDRIHPLAAAHPTILNNVWPHLAPLLKTR